MTFRDDKRSVQHSKPREAIHIVHGTVNYRMACGDQNLVIGGNAFLASTADRSEIGVSTTGSFRECSIVLPLAHPFSQRYFSKCIPPGLITATIWEKQVRSGEAMKIWQGLITSGSFDGDVAKFLVPSRLGQLLQRRLPTFTAGRQCSHILFDADTCRADLASHSVVTEIVAIDPNDPRRVTVAEIPNEGGGGSAQWGSLTHIGSGENMTIFDAETVAPSGLPRLLVLQMELQELQVGDPVEVTEGCQHNTTDCHIRYGNQMNYGGSPEMPTNGVFAPDGLGIQQSD